MKPLQQLKSRLTDAYASVARRLTNLWHRLIDEPHSADAAADLAVCAVALCCPDQRVVNFARTLVSIIRSAIRNLSGRDEPAWELGWA